MIFLNLQIYSILCDRFKCVLSNILHVFKFINVYVKMATNLKMNHFIYKKL